MSPSPSRPIIPLFIKCRPLVNQIGRPVSPAIPSWVNLGDSWGSFRVFQFGLGRPFWHWIILLIYPPPSPFLYFVFINFPFVLYISSLYSICFIMASFVKLRILQATHRFPTVISPLPCLVTLSSLFLKFKKNTEKETSPGLRLATIFLNLKNITGQNIVHTGSDQAG